MTDPTECATCGGDGLVIGMGRGRDEEHNPEPCPDCRGDEDAAERRAENEEE